MLESLTLESFTNLVGTDFHLDQTDGNGIVLRLCEAVAVSSAPGGQRQPFSLLFEMEGTADLAQGMYAIQHAQAGALELFLVPVQPSERGSRFEAIFT